MAKLDQAWGAYVKIGNLDGLLTAILDNLTGASTIEERWQRYTKCVSDLIDDCYTSRRRNRISWVDEFANNTLDAMQEIQKYASSAGPKDSWPRQMREYDSRLERCRYFESLFCYERPLLRECHALINTFRAIGSYEAEKEATGFSDPGRYAQLVKSFDESRALCAQLADHVESHIGWAEEILFDRSDLELVRSLSSVPLFRSQQEEMAGKLGLPEMPPQHVPPTKMSSPPIKTSNLPRKRSAGLSVLHDATIESFVVWFAGVLFLAGLGLVFLFA